MKPWEETWSATGHGVKGFFVQFNEQSGAALVPESRAISTGIVEIEASKMMGRARLAAAAPEMARLLLTRVDNTDSGRDDVDWYCFACHQGGWHDDDCQLIAVLRKAGVLE